MKEFPNHMAKSGVGKHLVKILPRFHINACKHFPSEYLCKLFVRMRIHYILKFGNRELSQVKNGKKNRKYFKITHI